MRWFSQEILEPEPPAAPPIDRVEETQSRVRELKSELAALDAEMLAFKTQNKIRTDRFGRLLSVHSPGMNGYAAIERAWRELLRRRDKVVSAWHRALHEWSEVKEREKLEVSDAIQRPA